MFGAAMLMAFVHRWIGEPLGEGATAKLSEIWQTLAMFVVVYAPVLTHYKRQASLAERDTPPRAVTSSGSHTALRVAKLPRKEDATHDHDDDGPRHGTTPR